MELIANKTKERLSLDDFKMKENVLEDPNNLDAQGGNPVALWRFIHGAAVLGSGIALAIDQWGDDDCH